jgi:hypothetical protein
MPDIENKRVDLVRFAPPDGDDRLQRLSDEISDMQEHMLQLTSSYEEQINQLLLFIEYLIADSLGRRRVGE